MANAQAPLVGATNLRIAFGTRGGLVAAVRGATFEIAQGETAALVGESGSGKTVTALSLERLLPEKSTRVVADRLTVAGTDVLTAEPAELRHLRSRRVAMIFRDPLRSLAPTIRIGSQVAEAISVATGGSRRSSQAEAQEALRRVGIPDVQRRARDYRHQFSGGQRQRIMIAMAIARRPQLLVADEPTTALDVTTQAQILDLILELRGELGMGLLLITHDLSVVARVCDRVLVMYAGRIVESGSSDQVFRAPAHPYTMGLLQSIPRVDRPNEAPRPIRGSVLAAGTEVEGCSFAARCPFAREECQQEPPLRDFAPGRRVACWRAEEIA